MNILVTGGMGFIGANFIEYAINKDNVKNIFNVDCPSRISSAANTGNTKEFEKNQKYFFKDVWLEFFDNPITSKQFRSLFETFEIDTIVHFAAESHVDNSIKGPRQFVLSNVMGTFNLLEMCRMHYPKTRFHHISTDEVYGALGESGSFTEETPYDPSSPYSATKASSDHLVRSYFRTFGLPVTISNCSNNYGPKQHDEKLIPTIIRSIAENKKIPVYGNGSNVRDWLYVEDHCEAIWNILQKGKLGESYNIGGNCEKRNLEVIEEICKQMDVNSEEFIEFVEDRKGHDYRYSIDNSKYLANIGDKAKTSFEEGIDKTLSFYKDKYSL
jgi:dTDP-glucose 4,6-dehydratase